MLAVSQPKRFDHPWIDDHLAPIYRLTYPRLLDEDDVALRNAEILAWYRGLDHPIAWLVDASHVRDASSTVRKLQSQHMKRIEPYAARWDVCDAFVVPSALLRGYLTAIFWLAPPPYEHQSFATVGEALAWVRTKLT